MKKQISLYLIIVVCIISVSAFGSPGDTVPDVENGLWQIVASGGLVTVINTMNGMPTGFHASSSPNIFVNWMQITFAQTGSLAKSFPDDVYYLVLTKIIGYNFDDARIPDSMAAPGNVAVDVDEITCDQDPTGLARDVILYAWNFVDFTESAITGSLSGGTWTFSGLSAGNYVLAYNDQFNSIPTAYITVP